MLDALGVGSGEELVVRREVTSAGRSRAWIDDVAVTVGALQRLAPHLVAIHGQHEQRGLADPATHLALIDEAGGLEELRAEVAAAFAAWRAVDEELAAQRRALASRRDRLDVITFQMREIEEARVEAGRGREPRRGAHPAAPRRADRRAARRCAGRARRGRRDRGSGPRRPCRARAGQLGLNLGETAEALEQARILAEEAERDLGGLSDRVRIDPPRLEVVEARLAMLERLARKYGGSLAATLVHRDGLLDERAQLEGVEDDIARLEDALARAGRVPGAGLPLSARRAEAAAVFAREVVVLLGRLGMPQVRLELRLAPRLAPDGPLELDGVRVVPAADGIDVGEFFISPNPGEETRPMVRIASGGELSRIHLAMRTVLRERLRGDALTLLFDEVDAASVARSPTSSASCSRRAEAATRSW